MRILWVASVFYPAVRYGGNVTQAWEECKALAAIGAAVEVVTIDTGTPSSRWMREERLSGVTVRYHPRTIGERRGLSFGLMRDAFGRAASADVVHLNSPWQLADPFAALGARRSRTPLVMSLRGTFMPYALAQHRIRKLAYLAAVEGHVMNAAAAIIASNDREQAAVARRWRGVRVVTLPPVVDVERFAGAATADIRGRWGIPADAPLVLFVGRNHPVKGLDLLMDAFRGVVGECPNARLFIAGPDERGTRADLERMADVAGVRPCIVAAGMLTEDDKAAAYREADLLVMPSRQEGFGQVAAEAMAAGLPVIVTNETGIAPLVAEADAGVVVPVDPRAIAAAITRLIRAPADRSAMGARAATYAAKRFAGPAIAHRMLEVYRRAIETRG